MPPFPVFRYRISCGIWLAVDHHRDGLPHENLCDQPRFTGYQLAPQPRPACRPPLALLVLRRLWVLPSQLSLAPARG